MPKIRFFLALNVTMVAFKTIIKHCQTKLYSKSKCKEEHCEIITLHIFQMISSNKVSSLLSSLSIFVLLVVAIGLTYQVRLLYQDHLKQRRLEQYKADLDLIQSQFDQVDEDIDQVRQEFDIYKKYHHAGY